MEKVPKNLVCIPSYFIFILSEFSIFLFVYLRVVSLEPCGKMCFSIDLILFHLANTIIFAFKNKRFWASQMRVSLLTTSSHLLSVQQSLWNTWSLLHYCFNISFRHWPNTVLKAYRIPHNILPHNMYIFWGKLYENYSKYSILLWYLPYLLGKITFLTLLWEHHLLPGGSMFSKICSLSTVL